MNVFKVALMFVCFIISFNVFALENLKIDTTIYSKIFDESRKLSIRLPSGYHDVKDENKNYPVLYLLDGYRSINLVHENVTTLSLSGVMPDIIIVAIESTNRRRDFTPIAVESEKDSGGADKFINFMEDELIPFVSKDYRVENFRILAGHSLGGLLTLHAFHSRPHLFQAHFSFSPSLYWGDSITTKSVTKFLENSDKHHSYLYTNMGNEGLNTELEFSIAMREGFIEIRNVLEQVKINNFRYQAQLLEDEIHLTTPVIGMYQALRNLYKDWFLPPHIVKQGLPAILVHFENLSAQFGYKITPHEETIYIAGLMNIRHFNNKKAAFSLYKYNVELYPNSPYALATLAEAYQENNQLEQAANLTKKALKLVEKTSADHKYLLELLESIYKNQGTK
jgi:hypothetical protein